MKRRLNRPRRRIDPPLRNHLPWLLAVSNRSLPAPIEFRRESEQTFAIRFADPQPDRSESVHFYGAIVDEERLDRGIRSGEPFAVVTALETDLRAGRVDHPNASLGAWLNPGEVWPRQPLWMLGEFLAERDLFLWVDLRSGTAERTAGWLRVLVESGLTGARTVVLLDAAVPGELGEGLQDSGIWLVRFEDDSSASLGQC